MTYKTIQLSILSAICAVAMFSCGEDKPDNPEPPAQDAKISIAAIGGVTAPAAGATPVTTITATGQFTGTVTWQPAHAAFAHGTAYTATVTLTPKAGYTLTGVAANFFTVAGAIATNAANSGTITAAFPKTADEPAPPTFTGAEVKSVNWGTPAVTMNPVGPTNWSIGSAAEAVYTGSVVLTLTFSDGSTKDSTVSLIASSVAKHERYLPSGNVYLLTPIPETPVPAVVTDLQTTDTDVTETVRFNLAGGGAFYFEYTVANSIVSVSARGQKVPITFGNGTLEMTKLEKVYVKDVTESGKEYGVYNYFPTMVFKHPAGNLAKEFPSHAYQLAELKSGSSGTFIGAEVVSINFPQPKVDRVNVGPAFWDVGSTLTATYTGGSATLKLKFSDGTSKDTTINNLSASVVAKYERRVPKTLISGRIYVDSPMETSPVQAVIVDKATTSTTYTETVRFTVAKGDLYWEYSIANSLINVLVRGQQVPVSFGNGTLEMTRIARTLVDIAYKDDKLYNVYNNTYVLAFKHPAATLVEEIQQAIQVAEPRP